MSSAIITRFNYLDGCANCGCINPSFHLGKEQALLHLHSLNEAPLETTWQDARMGVRGRNPAGQQQVIQ